MMYDEFEKAIYNFIAVADGWMQECNPFALFLSVYFILININSLYTQLLANFRQFILQRYVFEI
jgi:hypothetical protein